MGHFEGENYLNIFLNLGLLILILPVMFLVPNILRFPITFGITAIMMSLCGLILFSMAKFSMYKQGKLFSFGSSGMTQKNKVFYRLGYTLIVLASMIAVSILFVGMHVSGS